MTQPYAHAPEPTEAVNVALGTPLSHYYSTLSDSDLLHLSHTSTLTDEARLLVQAEIRKRCISPLNKVRGWLLAIIATMMLVLPMLNVVMAIDHSWQLTSNYPALSGVPATSSWALWAWAIATLQIGVQIAASLTLLFSRKATAPFIAILALIIAWPLLLLVRNLVFSVMFYNYQDIPSIIDVLLFSWIQPTLLVVIPLGTYFLISTRVARTYYFGYCHAP